MQILIALTLWTLCGYYAAGYAFAWLQQEYAEDFDARAGAASCTVFAVGGPLGLLLVWIGGLTEHGRAYPWQGSRWRA